MGIHDTSTWIAGLTAAAIVGAGIGAALVHKTAAPVITVNPPQIIVRFPDHLTIRLERPTQ